MKQRFTFSGLKIFFFIALVSTVFTAFPQVKNNGTASSNNSFNVSDNLWESYLKQAAVLLEKVDAEGFLNGVIVTSHGNIADKNNFILYVGKEWKKDLEKLIFKIGTGAIINEQNISIYLTSLQPKYKNYFTEFQAHRAEIIISQEDVINRHNKQRSPNPVNPSPQNCGFPCTNPGFESGNSFWDFWGGNPATAADPATLTAGFNAPTTGTHPNPHLIVTAGGFDPTVGGTILPVVPPGGGNSALRLGDLSRWGGIIPFISDGSWGAARASISFTVSASNANFTYRYAIVIEDPNDNSHDPVGGFTKRPYFRAKLRDQSGNVLNCGDYEVVADASQPGFSTIFTETSQGSNIWYRPWTTVFVPLSSYIGQCVTLEFTASDCVPGGHMGYGYVDCSCDPLDIISSSPNVCGGTSVTLSAPAGGATYTWTDSLTGGTIGFVGPTNAQTAVVSQAGVYKVVITSVAGSSCTTTLYITIGSNPSNPVAHFTNDTVCAGSPMHFHDTSTPTGSINGWKWDFDHDGVIDDTTQNPTHIFPALGTYPVTLIIAWGACNAVDTQNVYVTTGNPPVLTPAGPFCAGNAAVNLVASIPGGTWGGPGITDAALGTFTPSPSIIGNDTVTYTAVGACPSSASEVIVVTTGPVADAGSDLTICSGGSGTIGATTVAGYTYAWSPTTGITSSTTISDPTVSLTDPSPSASTTTTYSLTVTASGCTSTDMVDVIVNAVTIVNAGSSQRICPGATITLDGSVGGSATSGTWSGGTGTYSPNNTTLNAVYTPSAAESAADSVTLTLTTNDPAGPCTFSSSNVIFRFYPVPIVDFSADSVTGCKIHCTDFTNLSTIGLPDNITSYTWDFGDNSAGSTAVNPTHCFLQTGYYDVQLIAISNHGCTASLIKNHFVHIYATPVAEFYPTPVPATLIDPTVTLNNQSSSDVTYWHWDFGDGASLSPSTASPSHVYPNDTAGNYIATLIVHNADGCYDTVSHEIFMSTGFSFFIPNAFTPNGDKTNDYFFGTGIGIIKYDLWIFDRWGNMIFHGIDLNDKWNGKANNGSEMAQMDVYVWKVTLTDVYKKAHNYIGTVTLVK